MIYSNHRWSVRCLEPGLQKLIIEIGNDARIDGKEAAVSRTTATINCGVPQAVNVDAKVCSDPFPPCYVSTSENNPTYIVKLCNVQPLPAISA